MWALVKDDTIVEVARLPHDLVRLDDGTKPLYSQFIDPAILAACGWLPVVDNPPAHDPATQVLERGDVVLVDDTPTRTYTVRAKTAAELAADADAAAREAKAVTVGRSITWLRQHAASARNATATSGNAVAVLNVVLDDLAVFLDGFADLLEAMRMDERGNG